MNLEQYLTNNSYLIIPDNLKTKVIMYLNSLDYLLNVKIITINELISKLEFNYTTKTIYYLMQKNNIDYNNAIELINNMYYLLEDNYDNKKLSNLLLLKKELLKKNLLIKDPYFKDAIKGKTIFIYGFDYIKKYYLELFDRLNNIATIKYIPKYNNNYFHEIYSFDHLNHEIEFIANDIINKNLNLRNVYIYGINKDNESTVKRIFNNYNLKINTPSKTCLYETKIGEDFFQNIDNINAYLETIKSSEIKELIINILNKYYWVDNIKDIENMLEYEFKHTFIPNDKYTNSINYTNLFDDYFSDNDYVYIINFNAEYIPFIYRDIDLISDKEKPPYLETTIEKNNIEKEKWNSVIKNIKNLIITSSKQSLIGNLNESLLVNDYHYTIINKDYEVSNHSNKSNQFNLGIILDNYQKYNIISKDLANLLTSYPHNGYCSYDNKYTKIELKDNFKLSLSYSKMNTYFECPFKYYCENILKLNTFEETFDTWIGSLCHYILSKIYDKDFDYEKAKEEFIINNPFNLTSENIVFLNKILTELKDAIKYIKSLQTITKYQTIETEKNINISVNNINFIGIIDKIMHYKDNVVLVDYKTGNTDIDLRLTEYGLNMQLPTYIYLIKKIYPNTNIVGIYLEHILKPIFNKELDQSSKKQYEKSLKLLGFTLDKEEYIKDLDPTYHNSDYISGMKMSNSGFSPYSKLLNKDTFDRLDKLVENKISKCANDINNANFTIEPKIVGIDEISCKYCPFKSVCFKTEKDLKYLQLDNDLTFLGGDVNELD